MSRSQLIALLGLALAAGLTAWLAWLLREPPVAPALTGPPRSDYFLIDFQLVALDAEGKEAFAGTGPRLARHPHAGTIEVSEPKFTLPDASGGRWEASAESAWVSAEADELRLQRSVRVESPPGPAGRSWLQSERLDLFPLTRRVESNAPVTASGPGFILRGIGLEAELDSRRFQLKDQVSARYEPSSP